MTAHTPGHEGRSFLEGHYPVILLFFAACALRLFRLTKEPLTLDEAAGLYTSSLGIAGLIKDALANNAHPPLFFLLEHFACAAGKSELILRLLPAFAGTVCAVFTYRLSSGLFGKKTAVCAALLVAISPVLVFHSQEARPHILGVTFSVIYAYMTFRLVHKPGRNTALCYTACAVLLLYAHIHGILLFATASLYYFAARRNNTRMRTWILLNLLAAVAFAPWAVFSGVIRAAISGTGAFSGAAAQGALSIDALARTAAQLVCGYHLVLPPLSAFAVSVAMAAFLLLSVLFLVKRRMHDGLLFFACFFFIPMIAAIIMRSKAHAFDAKQILLFSPFLFILLAAGAALLRRTAGAALVSCILAAGLFSLAPLYAKGTVKEDWKRAASLVEANARHGECVFFDPDYTGFAFDYYYRGALPRFGFPKMTPAVPEDLKYVAGHSRGVWLVECFGPTSRPRGALREWLADNMSAKQHHFLRGMTGDILLTSYAGKD